MQLTIAQLQAEPLMLTSLVKPLLILLVIGGWAWLVGRLSKDAGFFYTQQKTWGLAHIAAGLLGFGAIFLIPVFFIGLPLGLLILGGEAFAYVAYRNKQVPEEEKWSGIDIVRKAKRDREVKADIRAREKADVKLFNKNEVQLDIPHGSDPRTPAFELFEKMLVFAVQRSADRLEMVVDKEKAGFSVRIDGTRYKQEAPPPELGLQLIQYLKENAGMDPDEHRRKQHGKMWVEVEEGDRSTLDLLTAGSTRSRQLTIDIDAEGRNDKQLVELGLTDRQLETLNNLTQDLSRVVLFSSLPHQGTTTSMYAVLKEHDPYTSSVMTFEDEKPFDVEGVNHNPFPANAANEQILEKFSSLLRADPNVMLLSRLINTEMAKLVIGSAEDTRFYIPLPAKDTAAGLRLWIKVIGDRKNAADALAAIVSQRLMRKLCSVCKSAYNPNEAATKKLNLPRDQFDHLYKASGKVVIKDEEITCPTCHGLGYRGRLAVFEVMYIDNEARSLIASGESDRLRAHFRKQKMLSLQEAALAKVVDGTCDIKEVTRIMSESKKG